MSSTRQAVGITLMVLGVALLILTTLVHLPGRRLPTRHEDKLIAVGYLASFTAMLGGAWISAQPS